MGVKIFDIVPATPILLESLAGKKLAVDTSLFLYQFLATIRTPDGMPLTDPAGKVTSHLVGLFARTAKLRGFGILPAFVFDGKPPEMKRAEQERRAGVKAEAARLYEQATAEHDTSAMQKYGGRTSRLTHEMVEEAKTLATALGCPIVQAPSEGEAQAAFMAKSGDVWATASQDADSLLFGTPRLVRNLAATGRRKKGLSTETVPVELIELAKLLDSLGIDQDQLVAMSILIGTDYNYGGIKGIGPKKALDMVRKHGHDFAALFAPVKWDFPSSWNEIYHTFISMPVSKDYSLEWKQPDKKAVFRLLVDEHGFSTSRVEKTLSEMTAALKQRSQTGLSSF
ncbi:flap endonuclease-1 [Candidatus Woesearchaeota archaeon]|nr:flap endonuclease-1 [Candidatus Woesearchaeota archaeon]